MLFLLHGYAGSAHHWHEIAIKLSQNYRVIVPNLSHLYMGSTKISFTDQVDYLAQYIAEFATRAEPVHIAGVSYGGALAWATAIKKPELIDRIVLINPMPPRPAQAFANKFLRLLLKIRWPMLSLFAFILSPLGRNLLRELAVIFRAEKKEYAARFENMRGKKLLFVANLVHRFVWILSGENWKAWRERWGYLSSQVFVIYDPHDPLFKPQTYQKLIREFDIDKWAEIPGTGHMAIVTHAGLIGEKIEAFLAPAPARFKVAR